MYLLPHLCLLQDLLSNEILVSRMIGLGVLVADGLLSVQVLHGLVELVLFTYAFLLKPLNFVEVTL